MYESYLSDCFPFLRQLVERTSLVSGDIIECGSARCGTSVMLGKHVQKLGLRKKIFALDSYGEGFDEKDLQAEIKSGSTIGADSRTAFRYISFDYVNRKVEKLGLKNVVIPVKGFFRDTLSTLRGPFSLAIIDCDLGTTVRFCLEALLPMMSSQSLIMVDEYGVSTWSGVRPAVEEFVATNLPHIASVDRSAIRLLIEKN
jgi:hypothetical protein